MSDIVNWLRAGTLRPDVGFGVTEKHARADEAADEIERLRAQVAALREVLRELHALVEGECPRLLDMDSDGYWELEQRICAALEEK